MHLNPVYATQKSLFALKQHVDCLHLHITVHEKHHHYVYGRLASQLLRHVRHVSLACKKLHKSWSLL